MPKRSPWERHHKREGAANAKMFQIWLSANHPCHCGHPQGFHRDTGDGKNIGRCEPADCNCTAFEENVLAGAQLGVGVLPTTGGAAGRKEAADNDALTRAMRAEEQRDVSADEVWDWALHADRSRPNGKPRRSTKPDEAVLDALRALGGNPEDLTG